MISRTQQQKRNLSEVLFSKLCLESKILLQLDRFVDELVYNRVWTIRK